MTTQKKLIPFIWYGKNKAGAVISGEINANSIAIVKAELRRQGMLVDKIQQKRRPLFSHVIKEKIKPVDVALFIRQLSTLLGAGIPIVQAIGILERGQSNATFKT